MKDRADVVVVGSGAGGGPVALTLAHAGIDVVILEKGDHPKAEALVHDEVQMERGKFLVPALEDEPHTMRFQGEGDKAPGEAAPTRDGWTANVVGGGTVHFSGFFHRMKPIDMRMRSTLGAIEGASLADWPISYADLERHYARVDEAIGVSGEWKRHPFEEPRSAPYPLPPLEEHPIARAIDAAAARLGMHTYPTPRAILSRPYRGRKACVYCPMCPGFGCPIGAKGSTLTALLPAAVATGHCEIRSRCMATEVVVGSQGTVTGVVYRDANGFNRYIEARCVVLACTAVETARLLLLSRSARFPNGLANSNGHVGKNLLFVGACVGGAAFRSSGPGREWLDTAEPGRSAQRSLQDFYFLDEPYKGVQKGGTISFVMGEGGPIAMAEMSAQLRQRAVESSFDPRAQLLWGKRLKDRLREQATVRRVHFECFAEFYTNPGTYVDLDPKVRDRWGMPVARMTIRAHPLSRKTAGMLGEKALALARALEPDDAAIHTPYNETKFLQGGTCRFGSDPATSVLDPDCRAHEVSNLYVSDSSFLPTSGGVPPTLTIMANAFRVAEKISARLRARTL